MTAPKYLSSLTEAVTPLGARRNLFCPLRHGSMRGGVYEDDDLLFVEAGALHRFAAISANFPTWVVFRGPRGGEQSAGAG